MKTKNTNIRMILAVALLALTTTAQAKSWRINNDARQNPNFTSITAATNDSRVMEGDTLYLDPGCNLTSEQNVTKKVTIIGCGYEGNGVPNGQATISGRLNIKAAESKVLSLVTTNDVYIMADNVTLERCRTSCIRTSGSNCKNAVIRQCYCVYENGEPVIKGDGNKNTDKSANWRIENCIILANGPYSAQCISKLFDAKIYNNLLIDYYNNSSGYTLCDIGNSEIKNNIIIHTGTANRTFNNVDTDQIEHNVISSDTRSSVNRVGYTNLAAIYTGDVQSYVLTEDSPAKNYGTDGQDCGIFGGNYPYVKGGLPYGHPYYTRYVISPRADENGKVKVSLNIKMQDE